MRSTLRLKSVKQMMRIIGEAGEEEDDEIYYTGVDHFIKDESR